MSRGITSRQIVIGHGNLVYGEDFNGRPALIVRHVDCGREIVVILTDAQLLSLARYSCDHFAPNRKPCHLNLACGPAEQASKTPPQIS